MKALLSFTLALCLPAFIHLPNVRAHEETDRAGSVVGAILPLSGDMTAGGVNVQRGIELALNDAPKMRAVFEDETFCDTKKALSAFHKLVSQHRAKLIVTGCLNATKVIAPLAKKYDVLILSAGLLSGEETQEELARMLSLSGQIATEGDEIAKLVMAQNRKLVAFVRYEDEFTAAVLRAIERKLRASGSSSTILDLPIGGDYVDFTPLLVRAKARGADALLSYVGEKQLVALMKRRGELDFTVPTFSGFVIESNAFPKDARMLLEGTVYAYPKLADPDDPHRLAFERAYRMAYGDKETPNSTSYFAFDGMHILSQAVASCKSDSPDCVRRYFLQNGPYSGASGRFSFDTDGYVNRAFVVKTVRDGEFVEAGQ